MIDAINPTIIDSLYEENTELLSHLELSKEISLHSSSKLLFSKILILSSASYFEEVVTNLVLDHCVTCSDNNAMLISFVKNKAIKRQYHSYFKWDGGNVNTFLSLFGEQFKAKISVHIESQPELKKGMKSFINLGNLRNELVHLNFANYLLEKTPEEIYKEYKDALNFLIYIQDSFKESR